MAETKNTKAKGNASNANKKGSVKKVNTNKNTNVQNKKKTTNSKQNTTKKVNTQKNNEVKKKSTNVATKSGQAKKSNASKNTVQNNKQNKGQTKKPIKVEVEKPKVNKVANSIEDLKAKVEKEEKVEPVIEEVFEEEIVEEDTKAEKVEIEENDDISESHDEDIAYNVAADIDDERERKINRRIDIGILIVIIGLFILVLTTYLSSEIDLSINVTRILIISSLIVETIGMIIMVINIWKRK